jgi:rRNA maturation endonuclease Nob1
VNWMKTVYILDTAALLTTWTQKQRDSQFVTTPDVIEEIQNRPSISRVQTLQSVGLLQIRSPDEKFLVQVQTVANQSGDEFTLSKTDESIIALALAEAERDVNSILVSSDFAVLNTATHLGVRVLDLTGKMNEQRIWIYVCPACNNKNLQPDSTLVCPVCGTLMIRRTIRRQKIPKDK